jgi:hypothetical protein
MNWRETAVIPENASPDESVVDSICATIPDGQKVLLACRVLRFEFNFAVFDHGGTVVLTNQALMFAKDRTFGRPKADRNIPLQGITSVGAGPLRGVGPTWEVTFIANRGAQGTMYLRWPPAAEQVEAVFGAAVSDVLTEAVDPDPDPDLAKLHRELAAGEAQPPGDIGQTLTPSQIVGESRKIRHQVASGDVGDLRAAWDRRVELGYGVPSEGVPQADRFWLDAAPAIAGLRLGLKDHPMVKMCCGMAEYEQNHEDPEQRAAVEEFKRLFFG